MSFLKRFTAVATLMSLPLLQNTFASQAGKPAQPQPKSEQKQSPAPVAPRQAESYYFITVYQMRACLKDGHVMPMNISQTIVFTPVLSREEMKQLDAMNQSYYGRLEASLKNLVKDLNTNDIGKQKGNAAAWRFRGVIQPQLQNDFMTSLKAAFPERAISISINFDRRRIESKIDKTCSVGVMVDNSAVNNDNVLSF